MAMVRRSMVWVYALWVSDVEVVMQGIWVVFGGTGMHMTTVLI